MRATQVWICAVCLCLGGSRALWADSYPTVRSLQRTFVVPDVRKADVSLDIDSEMGAPLYHLQCHSAGYNGDPDFDYSGDFECRLSLIGQHNTYSTLLTENAHQSRDWESRGRFLATALRGPCASIPQFGATRSFRLRSMDLTLLITDQRFTPGGKLSALSLTVKVRPDPEARRPIADIVPLPRTGVPTGCELRGYFADYSALEGNH